MAARRLIAILLVLLFLSSLAAALAPVQQGTKSVSSSTSTTSTEAEGAPALPDATATRPRLLRQSIDTSAKKPPVVRADIGDQLQLRVTSRTPGTVELAGIGPTEDVGAEQPAFFDVLIEAEGRYPVRFLESRRQIAVIEVAGSEPAPPPR